MAVSLKIEKDSRWLKKSHDKDKNDEPHKRVRVAGNGTEAGGTLNDAASVISGY